MKLSTLPAALALFASVSRTHPTAHPGDNCITQSQADKSVERWIGVVTRQNTDLGTQTATLDVILAEDFQEHSNSPSEISFPSKQAYINGTLASNPYRGVQTIEILVAGCNNILWHWKFTEIGPKGPVKGFNLFAMNKEMQVTRLRLEFDTISWGVNVGFNVTRSGAFNGQ
ncbi:hypothetical protein BDP81DRAFT_390110 [Colletotrichum phormii]|uniref:NTF2-like domain-containing protein n=1 Tax=Colletotrichum phormii TaxID=359342 RepID=A0AAJ0A278_9PEZI|nr:uncharacterized protein BDP81DRAFT_390110 [Colletotrichum phormii]KAK1655122.1 hypothetical protein BDP81DRAFT_390110 [Colletotrichum phormii]